MAFCPAKQRDRSLTKTLSASTHFVTAVVGRFWDDGENAAAATRRVGDSKAAPSVLQVCLTHPLRTRRPLSVRAADTSAALRKTFHRVTMTIHG